MSRKQRPKGGMITVPAEERPKIKSARTAKGLKQEDLAAKVGVSAATISNVETGRHPQMSRVAYAKLQRILFGSGEMTAAVDAALDSISTNAGMLDDAGILAVKAFIDALAAQKKTQ